jgi:uncharacterized protein (DUF2236 family)
MRTTMTETITERLAGDARVMNGAGYALLLQVAHPVVGAGVAEHSNFQEDPWGRLIRTLDYVNVTVFGGAEAAAAMGSRTRAMHKQIKGLLPNGERYHSLEPGPFAWVHATLAESILRSHELFVRPPSQHEREVFYADWRSLGRFIGVRERDLPPTYDGFVEYVAQMEAEVLEDTASARTVLASLAQPVRPDVPLLSDGLWKLARWPATHSARLSTVGMMRPVVRERLGLRWSRAQALEFGAFAAAQRAAGPLLPRPLKSFGYTYLDWRREALARQGLAIEGRRAAAAGAPRAAAA